MDIDETLDLVLLQRKSASAICKVLGSDEIVEWKRKRVSDVIPGEIATVQVSKMVAARSGVEGELLQTRLAVKELGLVPLQLRPAPDWDPEEHYWGEPEDPPEDWARPLVAFGVRPGFEMEQALPGWDPEQDDFDPVTVAVERAEFGDSRGAVRLLMQLLRDDLRCLDAHAHLGNWTFDRNAATALRHYEVGVRIGELSLPRDYLPVLGWGWIDNRPFLRCLHGFALCLWRLGRFDEALGELKRMLWLNPGDNQGARFLLDDVQGRIPWTLRSER